MHLIFKNTSFRVGHHCKTSTILETIAHLPFSEPFGLKGYFSVTLPSLSKYFMGKVELLARIIRYNSTCLCAVQIPNSTLSNLLAL